MKLFKALLALVVLAMAGGLQAGCGHPAPPPVTPAPAAAAEPARPAVERRDLSTDERAGGHTLSRHVGRTDAQLRQRLRDEPGISAASTYTDRETAERVVAAALTRQRAKVAKWEDRAGSRPNLTLNIHDDGEAIGRSIARRGRGAEPCHDATVVLRWKGNTFYVLTSYPETRR